MTDVRLTALNPVDSQVYPVACNTSGELLVAQDTDPDLTVTGDLTVDGTATFGGTALVTDANGNVGINTAAPSYQLDVNGSVRGKQLEISNPGFTSGINIGLGATQNNSALIDLIGDTTYSDYGFRILRGNNGANANTTIEQRGTGPLVINTREGATINFLTASVRRMTIAASGSIQIGTSTTSPNISLNADGTASFAGNVTAPNITSLSAVIAELSTKVETLMSLNARQVDISTDTP